MLGVMKVEYKRKLKWTTLIISILPLLVFSTIYIYNNYRSRTNEILYANGSQLSMNASSISELYLAALQKMNYISTDPYINQTLTDSYSYDLVGVFSAYENVRRIFNALDSQEDYFTTLIYSYNSRAYNGGSVRRLSSLDPDTAKKIEALKENTILYVCSDSSDPSQNLPQLFMYKRVDSMKEPLAIIEIAIPVKRIARTIDQELPQGGFAAYYDGSGYINILKANGVKNDSALTAAARYIASKSASNYRVIDQKLKYSSHHLLLFLPEKYIFQQASGILYYNIIMVVFFVLVLYIAVSVSSSKLTTRLKALINRLNKNIDTLIQSEEPLVHLQGDEFAEINEKFIELIDTMKDYHKNALQFEEEKRKLEYKILQERINPHFLYNTLSAIKWTYPDKVLETIIDSMVKYYRTSLSRGNEIIKISLEFDLIREYLSLQKFSYDSDFTFNIAYDRKVLDYSISKLLLQPIVENAILHGINGLVNGGGKIDITARLDQCRIIFVITDNGIGMPLDVAYSLLNDDGENPRGYGLRNVQQRIKLIYGDNYGLEIESKQGEGTKVTVTIAAVPWKDNRV